MKLSPLAVKIRQEAQAFLDAVSRTSERIYLFLLTLYVLIYYVLNISWATNVSGFVGNARYALLGVVMWGSAVFLFFVIADWKDLWKKNLLLLLTGGVIAAATGLFAKKMSTNSYGVVMDFFFIVMAYRKDYKKMLLCILGVSVTMLLIAAVGLPAGYTWDMLKPENAHPGHSLGTVYPNTWGYLAFQVLMIVWYLYMRNRPLITFPVFWAVCLFMFFYISCRTIAGITLVFPVMATFVDWIERRTKRREKLSPAGWAAVAVPFLAFGGMLFVSMQVEWVHKHFYHRQLHNLAMRFVQGGLYFRTYGFPLIGNPYRSNVHTYINVNKEFLEVGILDSSFAAYMIMRGLLWILLVMFWLCLAHWKAMKKHDYAIPFLSLIILLFAMMERPGLEMWYNFILLYPLAKVAQESAAIQHAGSETIQTAQTEEAPDQMMEENDP